MTRAVQVSASGGSLSREHPRGMCLRRRLIARSPSKIAARIGRPGECLGKLCHLGRELMNGRFRQAG